MSTTTHTAGTCRQPGSRCSAGTAATIALLIVIACASSIDAVGLSIRLELPEGWPFENRQGASQEPQTVAQRQVDGVLRHFASNLARTYNRIEVARMVREISGSVVVWTEEEVVSIDGGVWRTIEAAVDDTGVVTIESI